MLQLLTCAQTETLCQALTNAAFCCCQKEQVDCRILVQTRSKTEAIHYLEKCDDICLITVEVNGNEDFEKQVELIAQMRKKGRNGFLLLIVSDLKGLVYVVNRNIQPSGVLTYPIDEASMNVVYTRIAQTYHENFLPYQQRLTLETGNSVYHIPMAQIVYLEAREKHVDIYTRLQCLTVCSSLKKMMSVLDERFIQCHRSYVVNGHGILSVDFTTMCIHLFDGKTIPLSRSSRDTVKAYLLKEQAVLHEN